MKIPVAPEDFKILRRTHPLDNLVAGWFFRCDEFSANCYTVEGRDLAGRRVVYQSSDPESALQTCVAFANGILQDSSSA